MAPSARRGLRRSRPGVQDLARPEHLHYRRRPPLRSPPAERPAPRSRPPNGASRGRRKGRGGRRPRRRGLRLRTSRLLLPDRFSQEIQDAPDGDTYPVRAVVQLVADLVEGLLEGEELDERPGVLLVVGVGSGPARALGVPFEESLPRALLPEPDPRLEALELLSALGAEVHHG